MREGKYRESREEGEMDRHFQLYRHADRQTGTQSDRQTDTQSDGHIKRQTDRHPYTQAQIDTQTH